MCYWHCYHLKTGKIGATIVDQEDMEIDGGRRFGGVFNDEGDRYRIIFSFSIVSNFASKSKQ